MEHDQTERRKNEHIDICLTEEVEGQGISTGLEKFRFKHRALPEIDFAEIDLSTEFLGKKVSSPFLISSMTGGTKRAWEINQRLAKSAEAEGWALGVGSMRAAIQEARSVYSFEVRKLAPSIPIFANIGAVQLNYGFTIEECKKAIDLIEADGLILHVNSLQEVFQPEGDTNFKNLLPKIEEVAKALEVPIGVKEVGMGIDSETATRLMEVGVDFIDVAGAGGTSWIKVESYRSHQTLREQAAEAFKGWGNATAECLIEIRKDLPNMPLIASGGLKNGVDAAKSIALGADLAGYGRALLHNAVDDSEQALSDQLKRIRFELQTAMFGIGASSIAELKQTQSLRQS
ncbi:type 2 isopentenyl-diphosphate Delta-isomerase [Guptibacillus algicola]|uniref:type 2 isopentenyl-diphosphate Delta-isomerase n=1 Tax=Guptibacillus algicola TaxID=225844 RepID=UPI001CD6AFE8|nr:type 2 isopentenyl-diphosphate Delta-isomerase [Alkalihalobacillus algicola]MCA0988256.1 type 2 isopentenyl-diphosphate Delta-isomerase [Alkalihalobacillus algicola]